MSNVTMYCHMYRLSYMHSWRINYFLVYQDSLRLYPRPWGPQDVFIPHYISVHLHRWILDGFLQVCKTQPAIYSSATIYHKVINTVPFQLWIFRQNDHKHMSDLLLISRRSEEVAQWCSGYHCHLACVGFVLFWFFSHSSKTCRLGELVTLYCP